jgi:hypothetical protein
VLPPQLTSLLLILTAMLLLLLKLHLLPVAKKSSFTLETLITVRALKTYCIHC